MWKYILKRILLMLPTFFGATFLVYLLISFVPGGPFERAVMQIKAASFSAGGSGAVSSDISGSQRISPEVLDKLRRQFGLDKSVPVRYLIWLGLYPRELIGKTVQADDTFRENIEYFKIGERTYEKQRWVKVEKEGGQVKIYTSGVGTDFTIPDYPLPELPEVAMIPEEGWYVSSEWETESENDKGEIRVVQKAFSGIFQGDFGQSYTYNQSVLSLFSERLHISLYFGIISFLLTYIVCIPLGIMKAVLNGSKFDLGSSLLIFIGYSVPGFALGAVLLVLFGGGSFYDVFPLGGFRSINWDELSFFGKIWDQIYHTILPVTCYMVGSFASITILMKNSLLENLGQDYVRTAFAKGLDEKTVILRHTLRNSLIPIVARIGSVIGLFLAGSLLIEQVFDIDGIGLLNYRAIISVDYPVFLAFLVFGILVRIIGNLISDLALVLVDPRISLK